MAPTPDGPGEAEGDLLARIADGDVDAFEALYRRYVRPVFVLAVRRLHDRRLAAAATQDAFAAIWRTAPTYTAGDEDGAHWVFGVARDAVSGHGAHSAREEGWLAFRTHAAVAALPEPERIPLELTYWDGRSQSEIAELLGIPIGAVESRTRSALARLAAQLDGLA